MVEKNATSMGKRDRLVTSKPLQKREEWGSWVTRLRDKEKVQSPCGRKRGKESGNHGFGGRNRNTTRQGSVLQDLQDDRKNLVPGFPWGETGHSKNSAQGGPKVHFPEDLRRLTSERQSGSHPSSGYWGKERDGSGWFLQHLDLCAWRTTKCVGNHENRGEGKVSGNGTGLWGRKTKKEGEATPGLK